MSTLYVAMEDALLTIRQGAGGWTVDHHLEGLALQCVAVEPDHSERIYVGTEDQGLWRSLDGGRAWAPGGTGIVPPDVTAVAVGPGRSGRLGSVYAGTEPSMVFRSTDGGQTWEALERLTQLPSASSWSFPPRPETHHVRWIGVDPHDAGRLYVAIEAGALVRSVDGGDTWIDRTPEGPYDTRLLLLVCSLQTSNVNFLHLQHCLHDSF